ncbi:MAG: permease [Armatimonadetes bacterium]|nr:permease [Armatimonadota bacterium]
MKTNPRSIISLGATGVFLFFCAWGVWFGHNDFAIRSANSYLGFLKEMFWVLPMMFLLIGVFDVWVPREIVERHVGEDAGPIAILWMILLAMLQAGPLYGAFPVAAALSKKGCAAKYIFIYLGAFSVMKLPMLSFEITFLGWKFSLVRLMFTLPVFITIGYIMGRHRAYVVQ